VSAIALRAEPDTSRLGIGVTIVALTIMPILSRAKRRNANLTGNRALAADRSIGHLRLSCCADTPGACLKCDPAHSLGRSAGRTLATPIIVIEARRALRSEVCGC
jgi:hypothetical protein